MGNNKLEDNSSGGDGQNEVNHSSTINELNKLETKIKSLQQKRDEKIEKCMIDAFH